MHKIKVSNLLLYTLSYLGQGLPPTGPPNPDMPGFGPPGFAGQGTPY